MKTEQQAENFLYELENRFRNSTSTPIESRNMLLMDIYQIVFIYFFSFIYFILFYFNYFILFYISFI